MGGYPFSNGLTTNSLEKGDFFMKKIKKILFGLMLGFLVFSPSLPVAAEINTAAVDYLKAQSPDAWITMALAAASETGLDLTHLQSVAGTLSTDYAKAILALAAAGENPKTFGNIDYVAKLKTYFQSSQLGDENLINDDIWGILALAAAGESISGAEIAAAKNFILANQNSDGGWGYNVGGLSDTNDTAAAMMALLEAGLNSSSPELVSAISYLQSQQNADGGFPYTAGSESDSGSDAWVISAIYKLGQDPSAWQNNSNNPIDHLKSLQTADGSFKWVASQSDTYNTLTAYAVIALAGKFYPVGYYQGNGNPPPDSFHLRIEGQNNTICDADVSAANALEIVENGAAICGYTYEIEDTSWGPYLKKINEEEAAGMTGWMYFVNFSSPMVGAADYVLQEGEEVLWYYGEWGWSPIKLTVNENTVDSGESIEATVEYFDGTTWQLLPQAAIKGADQDYLTNDLGQIILNLADGYYTLFAEKSGFVRSNGQVVRVGDGVSQSVGLEVEIDQSGRGQIHGSAIIFEINPSQLTFGRLKPGQQSSQILTLDNSGTVDLLVSAVVNGDSVFSSGLSLDNQSWSNYTTELLASNNKEVSVGLAVSGNYIGSGIKTGELIFWAQAQ